MNKLYQKKWREENPEKAKGYQKKYRENNPKKAKESQRKYYYKNRLKQIAKSIRWNKEHPEIHIGRAKKWNEDNREKHKANKRAYRLRHIEKCRKKSRDWARENKEWIKKYRKEYMKNPEVRERYKKYMKEWHLKRREKIVGSPKPDNCPVCKRKPKGGNRGKGRICVDHCHKTGKIRGWLCDDCNVVLGRVNDKVEILKNLIKYLNKNS